jgi:RimJ/RimL family protein N-acetyltransferase
MSGRTPPVLTTDRLILRGHRIDDFPAVAALWSDRAVARYVGGRPASRQDAWMRLLRYSGLWPLLGYGYWAVTDKASGVYLGEVGLADFKRDLIPPLDGIPEISWVVAPAAQGKGYGTEAARAVLKWSDRHLAAPYTACIINPANAASLNVATKAGYVHAAQTLYGDDPVILLTRRRRG